MQVNIGIIGLAVMGQNLSLNLLDKGYSVAVYNRSYEKTRETLRRAGTRDLFPVKEIDELVRSLETPRKVILMVKAGKPVDQVIEQLLPHLSAGDIILDGGNSNYTDTNRRFATLKEKGIHFIGMGISGGEEGARYGPSIMPGGSIVAWNEVKDLLRDVSAKAKDGIPCCDWMGYAGAGHFVKTVHNGIEYGDMELIAETYDILSRLLQRSTTEIAQIFDTWNAGDLQSYLIEITATILRKPDDNYPDEALVNYILDTAGQKGTGKWTVHSALDHGIPVTLIATAVFQRFLSSQKELRLQVSELLDHKLSIPEISPEGIIEDLGNALYAAKLLSYSQGFELLRTVSDHYGWDLDLSSIARIWRAGCIIRSQFLDEISTAFETESQLKLLLLSSHFLEQIRQKAASLRRIVNLATNARLAIPGFMAALAYLDGLSSAQLPANLIQAQRDYFGAHGYQRIDDDSGTSHHTAWTD